MTIARYEILMKVIEIGNFTRAAEQLNMTQSAVSHAIASLEKEMGQPLLLRSKQARMTTTPLTDRLIPHISQILRSESIIRQELSKLQHQLEGTLKIGAFTSAASQLLPSMLAKVRSDYPGIKVLLFEGTYKEIEAWLMNGTIDLGFTVNLDKDSSLEAIPIYLDELVLGLPKSHILASREKIDVRKLDGMDFIMSKGSYHAMVTEYLSVHQVEPNITMEVLHCETLVNIVSQGLGVTLGPELLLQSYEHISTVKLTPTPRRQISLAYLEASPLIEAFLASNSLHL